MFSSPSVKRLFSVLFLGLVFAVVTSCSSGDSSTTASNGGTGTVALLLTDAPSDIFEEINITVVKAELLSDGGAVTIFQGERTFNLLDLTDARIFAIREGIAAGTYSKIRLTLTEIELVDYKDTDDTSDDDVFYPNLPGNGKLDLQPKSDFDVIAGGSLTIQIDMDATKSVHYVGNSVKGKYQFRPVVFITIVTDSYQERYVKLFGTITDLDDTDQSFKLCNTDIPVQLDEDEMDENSSGCVRVTVDDTTSIFGIDGMPAMFINLVEGEPATVFGYLQRDNSSDDDLVQTIAGAKSKKDDDDKDDDESDDDDYDEKDNDDDRELDDLVLKAALIELGPESSFQKLDGKATSVVDSNDQFTMDVDPGQGFITPYSLTVQIQDGTILINLQGEPVAKTDIDTDKLVNVRGVVDGPNDTIFASLIMVDTDSSTQLTGTVGANPDNSCGFTLATAGGDRSIATDSNTNAYLVVGGSSSPIEVSDLSAGQAADVYGNENAGNGCFDAHTIIAY